jgi:hypothetical protein
MHDCKTCGYSTDIKSNFTKHIKTKTHLGNLKNKNACTTCFKTFANKWNKNRHEKKCGISLVVETNNGNINNQIGNNNTANTTININLPNLENMESEKYRKYYAMEISEMIKLSVKDFVTKEINKQLLHEKCDFTQFSKEFSDKIKLKYFCTFTKYDKCKDCKIENDFLVYSCEKHRLEYKEVIRAMVEILTNDAKKNICITSLKQFNDDDGQILIKHANALYTLGILNMFLDKFEYKFMIEDGEESESDSGNEIEIDQKIILDLYETFYKKLEAKVKRQTDRHNYI